MKIALLDVKGLKKYFPIRKGVFRQKVGEIKACDDIDFTVYAGEVFGIVGETGSGKSTAARSAIRLIEPTAGSIFFDKQDLMSLTKRELKEIRKELQIVFQDPYASLNPRKTIGENVGDALFYHDIVKDNREKEAKVAETLEECRLSKDLMHRFPHELSGGQQQRVCIARALIMEPKLIVLDEAISSLDVSIQAQILNLLIELKEKRGLSYLFISHDLSVMRHISNSVAVMHRGKIVETGKTEELYSNPQHAYTKLLLRSIPSRSPRERRRVT